MPHDGGDNVGIVVSPGPDGAAVLCCQRLPAGIDELSDLVRRACHHDGLGRGSQRFVVFNGTTVQQSGTDQLFAGRNRCKNAAQLHETVGNVHHEDAARRQFVEVTGDRLARYQMNGNGVGGKGVDHQDIEQAVRFAHHRQAGITDNDRRIGRASGQKSKMARIAGDPDNRRVDLIVAPAIAMAGVTSEAAGAKADNADIDGPAKAIAMAEPRPPTPANT